MLQATAARTAGLEGVGAPVVLCNEVQVEPVLAQLAEIEITPSAVVVEPARRNTAPAVAAAALFLPPDAVMVVLPADHVITAPVRFRRALEVAVKAAAEGAIVTFGVVPSRAETGFGYIEVGPSAGDTAELVQFVEKPDEATAESYLATGRYLWNSGMFVFRVDAILRELERHVPEVMAAVAAARDTALEDDGVIRLGAAFASGPSISMDHAVMERTENGVVVPLDAGWSDVGSWEALWEATSGERSVTVGPVLAHDVERSYIRAESRPVAVIGLSDVVVVETADAVLVMDRRRAQDVRVAADWFAGGESE